MLNPGGRWHLGGLVGGSRADVALAFGESMAHFGIMLLSRTEEHLAEAWQAMKAGQREMASLDQRTDF
jgi:hypothetical protein